MQSDNASNYRDPIILIDVEAAGTQCYNEPGMGKDEGDANGGVNKRGLKRTRDQGRDQEVTNLKFLFD